MYKRHTRQIGVNIKMNSIVSVIIPTYNREKTITNSIVSVLNQTYSNIELFVIDDFSSDKTERIVKEIKDKRLSYIKLPHNVGQSRARNIGIMLSKGKYIAFNDSDDIWHKDKLQEQVNVLDEDMNVDLVYSSYILKNSSGKEIKMPNNINIDEISRKSCIYKHIINKNFIGISTIHFFINSKSLFQ